MNSQIGSRYVATTAASIRPDELIVDLFAGGGGASTGIEEALGRAVDVAVNHDADAIEMHAVNHPSTTHYHSDVFEVDPREVCGGRPVGLLWASPDCTHHSRARGGKPRKKGIRALAWVVVQWAAKVRPRVICLENVEEFRTWGPLDDAGHPIRERAGETFARFVGRLRALGYAVEHRVLCAADYGAPTSRKRLFLVARCDGLPICWPEPTHGPGRVLPYRSAAECIDWSMPCPSIFLSPAEGRAARVRRPLAQATLARIAEGVRRYVLTAAAPFVVGIDRRAPAPTVTGQGLHSGLVAAFLAKHYGGVVGQDLRGPLGTITAVDHHALVAVDLARGEVGRARQVAAFLSAGVGQDCREPLRTVVGRDRFGLVTVELDGEPWVVADIGMRMLQPHELLAAQFGPERARDYTLTGTKTSQVGRIGNSVCPDQARAVVALAFAAAADADAQSKRKGAPA